MTKVSLIVALCGLSAAVQAAPGCGTGHSPDECAQAMQQSQAKQNQKIEDARAMVRESWASNINLIKTIELSYKCGLADQFSANVAIRKIQGSMFEEAIRAGLIDDPTMSTGIEDVTKRGVDAGFAAAEEGACTRMTPAERGRLRALVGSMM